MPNQETTTGDMPVQIPFVGPPSTRSAESRSTSETEEILARLDSCGDLVHSELEAYRNSLPSDAVESSRDCLLSIVIPVYNEENTIARVISRVTSLPLNTQLVIVDDCSTDGTRDLLKKLDGLSSVKLILKEQNAGKGAALRTGFEHATGDFVVVQDADLEYDPSDIPRLIQPLIKGDADIVYGSRFIGEDQQDESWIHRAGNAVLTGASNLFSGLSLTDMETCYKAFNREVLEGLQLAQDRFGIEPELTAKLARRGYRFVEVPISYNSRGYSEGKKIGIRDLFNAIYCIGRYGITD
ncbi:glycosyltransferase family 2 protein [Mariniblastus sp.]|nr:glycosyltransferase family 2 protein [Mariniblastus sp.]